MGEVVAYIAEDTPAEDGGCYVPVPIEDGMCKVVEWYCEEEEEGGGHDESVAVHWEVMVDAM